MIHGQASESVNSVKKRPAKNRIIFAGVLMILFAFLVGFLPGYAKGQRQEKELRQARQENRLAQLRDLASLAYLQAIQKDYGLAAGTSTRLFDGTRELANQTLDSADRKSLEDLLSLRDPITSKLATGDSGVVNDLQALLVKTRQATAVSSGARQP
jgi:hypothetical protein